MNNNNERLCVKGNNNVCKVYKKVNENNGQNKHEHEKEKEHEHEKEACEGMIGVHINDKLRIIDNNRYFQERLQEEAIMIVFSEEIKQAIVHRDKHRYLTYDKRNLIKDTSFTKIYRASALAIN